MERISTVLDAVVKQRKCQQGHIGIAVIDELDNLHRGFSRRIAFLLVDQVDNLQIQGKIGLEVRYGVAGII